METSPYIHFHLIKSSNDDYTSNKNWVNYLRPLKPSRFANEYYRNGFVFQHGIVLINDCVAGTEFEFPQYSKTNKLLRKILCCITGRTKDQCFEAFLILLFLVLQCRYSIEFKQYGDARWVSCYHQSPASRLFVQ